MTTGPQTEAYVEERPDDPAGDLVHWRTSADVFGRHYGGVDCQCRPSTVPHAEVS